MNILILDRFLGGDGPGIYIRDLSASLLARGHRVGIGYGREAGDHVAAGVERFHISGLHEQLLGSDASRSIVKSTLASFAPDVVSAQCLDVLWFAEEVAHRAPLVATLHTHALTCPNWTRVLWRDRSLCSRDFGPACVWHTIVDRCGSRAPQAIAGNMLRVFAARSFIPQFAALQAVTPYMRTTLEAAGISSDKIFDLPYPAPFFDPTRTFTPSTRPLILFVGRLHATKGPDLLLEACARLSVPFEAVFVGGGPMEREVRRRARALGIARQCTFFSGHEASLTRAQISELYLQAALVAVPSLWGDPAPLVRLEALAHGRPIVGFESGGVSSCVEDGNNGFIVPRLDVSALAGRIEQILRDAPLRERMGRAALTKANLEHHPDLLAHRLENIYTSLIAGRSRRSVA